MKRVRAKRTLSQNFLVDGNIGRKIVAELGASETDSVLEVGPGHGELTDHLAGRVARLVVVEKDDRLASGLETRFSDRASVEVVHGDALEVDLAALLGPSTPGLVISNVPYGITSPLLFRLLDLRPLPRRLVLLVQREVAERITAPPGGKAYGALSVGVRARADVRVAFRVGRRAFRPMPAVDSAVVVIEPKADLPPEQLLDDLRVLTRVTFSRRRKQLGGLLRACPEYDVTASRVESVLGQLGISPRSRPETLTPEEFLLLAAGLAETRRGSSPAAAASG